MAQYGLEKVNKDPQMKKYKEAPFKEKEMTQEEKFGLKPQEEGHYDHHAEIMKEKMKMQEQENDQEKDIEEGEEYDEGAGIVRESDQFKVRKFDEDLEDQYAQNAQLGIKEVNDNRMIFRKLPLSIWAAGLCIVISALYLVYHLALG